MILAGNEDMHKSLNEFEFMILAGNEDIHKSLDEFEFGQDLKTDLEHLKIQCLHFFLVAIDPILFNLHVMRTCMIYWTSLNFG